MSFAIVDNKILHFLCNEKEVDLQRGRSLQWLLLLIWQCTALQLFSDSCS